MNTSSSPVYLDYSANTPADPSVLHRFCETELAFPGNANSAHTAGRAARARMDALTASIAALLDVQPEEIIYTSGASEANNTAIFGLARANRHVGRHIISTPLEHPSVSGCLTALQEQGYEIDLLDIGRDGKLDLTQLQALLRPDTALVCITAVDSELGTVQPVQAVSEILQRFPACRLHVDATQAIGKIPFDFSCADTASFAPHKFYGLCSFRVSLSHLTTQEDAFRVHGTLHPMLSGVDTMKRELAPYQLVERSIQKNTATPSGRPSSPPSSATS